VPPLRFEHPAELAQLLQPQQEHVQVVITLRLPKHQNFQQVLLYFCSRCFVRKLSQEVNKQGLECPLYRLECPLYRLECPLYRPDSSVFSYITDYDSGNKEIPL
jgi:hypothetical protein